MIDEFGMMNILIGKIHKSSFRIHNYLIGGYLFMNSSTQLTFNWRNHYFSHQIKLVRKLYVLLYMFVALGGVAQMTSQPVGARYLSLGAYSQQFLDVYATRANSASLAGINQAGVSVYGERRFMLDNLNLYTVSAALPAGNGAFGAHGSYFGFAQSNQTQLSFAYGRKVTKTIDVGGSFHYHNISQTGIYGNASAITGSIAMRMKLTDKITTGFNVFNPIRASWSKVDEERLPARVSLGVGYDASDKFFVTGELEKEENQPVNVNLAFHYQFVPQFFVRAGIASQTSNYFVGLGFQLKDFRLDLATSVHPQLGITPGVLLLINLGKPLDRDL